MRKNEIMIKPYMMSEISLVYGITAKTMRSWLKPINDQVGDRIGRYYTVKQVETIFKHFGLPYSIKMQEINSNKF